MKLYNLGSFVRVQISARDISSFNSTWPCSDLPERGAWFEFQRKNGDIVDMSPGLMNADGSAVSALCDDAKRFAGL